MQGLGFTGNLNEMFEMREIITLLSLYNSLYTKTRQKKTIKVMTFTNLIFITKKNLVSSYFIFIYLFISKLVYSDEEIFCKPTPHRSGVMREGIPFGCLNVLLYYVL